MNTEISIGLFPEHLNGHQVLVADGREVHSFLESRQKFTTWIRRRIRQYDFAQGVDYLSFQSVNQVPHQGGTRLVVTETFHVSLDMARELAMIERTAVGKRVRQYFIACERQLIERAIMIKPEPDLSEVHLHALCIDLRYADRAAINRQAWADVTGENAARFHARREVLLRQQRELRIQAVHRSLRTFDCPVWAQ